jgi:integrase
MEEAIASIRMGKREILVILLAYYAGLSGGEMQEVKASDISDDFSFLIAPDRRKIPLVPKLAEALKSLSELDKSPGAPILSSRRRGEKVSRVYTSNITKKFMEFAGMPGVRLSDLRVACVVNWMQQYSWEYVSQISGLELRVLTQRYQHYLPEGSVRPQAIPVNHTEVTPDQIRAMFQNHKDDLFGLILRLQVVHQLSGSDICNITWDMVDDEKNEILLPEKTIPITDDLRACLQAARAYSDTKWVLAFPNTKTPYTVDAISHLMSKTLLADGYAGVTVQTLTRAAEYLKYKGIVENLLKKEHCFSVDDFATASGLATQRARNKLNELEGEGLINQIGIRFYGAEKTIHPTQFGGVAQRLTETNGGHFTCNQFAVAIGIDVRSAATQLRRMISEGQIERISKAKYAYIQ